MLGAAQAPERARSQLALLLTQVVPEVEESEEVARRVDEARVQAVGLLATLLRTLTDILDRQARHDRQDVVHDLGP